MISAEVRGIPVNKSMSAVLWTECSGSGVSLKAI